MLIELDNKIRLVNPDLNMIHELKEKFRMVNPIWAENKREGRWNGEIPRDLFAWKWDQSLNVFSCLRGCTGYILSFLRKNGVEYNLVDKRLSISPDGEFKFSGNLKPFQEEAWEHVSSMDFGILEAATGSGKTVMALHAAAMRQQKCLIIVHTKDLLLQWRERIQSFISGNYEIGMIGDGKNFMADMTVATIQSLKNPETLSVVSEKFGFVIVDECHRIPSKTFSKVITEFRSKYMLGLSATPYRRDGLTNFIAWHLGRMSHIVDDKALKDDGHIMPVDLVCRDTGFKTSHDPSEEYSKMLSELASDIDRNWMIVVDIVEEYKSQFGVILVLSDRKSHCEILRNMLLFGFGITSGVLTGNLSAKKRGIVKRDIDNKVIRVIFATGQLVGEGFDLPAMEILFIATPIRFKGRVIQFVGRIRRPVEGKTPKVYDYRDVHIGVLVNSARHRRRVLTEMGK